MLGMVLYKLLPVLGRWKSERISVALLLASKLEKKTLRRSSSLWRTRGFLLWYSSSDLPHQSVRRRISSPGIKTHSAIWRTIRNMLGLGIVFKVLLLLINAMAILHEQRFLNKGMLLAHIYSYCTRACIVWVTRSARLCYVDVESDFWGCWGLTSDRLNNCWICWMQLDGRNKRLPYMVESSFRSLIFLKPFACFVVSWTNFDVR